VQLDKQELVDFLSGHFELDRDGLEDDLPLFSSSLLDSTSMVTLVAFLEEKTGLIIEADDLTLDNFDTISAIVSFCDARAS
jgi:acyl carrier protein